LEKDILKLPTLSLNVNRYENTFFEKNVNTIVDGVIIHKYVNDLINKSMSYGNLHYDITINFREEINFNTDKEVRKEANHLIRFLVKNTQLLTFLVIVPELNEKKKIHFRLFLAIRTFIGTNHYLRKNIEWIL